MNADDELATPVARRTQEGLRHGEITDRILGVFFDVYTELGTGFLEAVYQNAIAVAFDGAGLAAEREPAITVRFRGHEVGLYRPDFLVENAVIVELKVARAIDESTKRSCSIIFARVPSKSASF